MVTVKHVNKKGEIIAHKASKDYEKTFNYFILCVTCAKKGDRITVDNNGNIEYDITANV